MGEVSPYPHLCRCLLSSSLRACLASALPTKPGPSRRAASDINFNSNIFFPFYYFQMSKATHVRQSYSYAVTCTWLREESSSLCPHSGDPVPTAAGWDCPSPRHMQMLAHPPWQHSVFFASVDILLTKSKASGFALPSPLWDCSFLGPSEKQIQIISGNVGVGRYRRVTLQCGPLPRRHPHGLPQHESLTCTLNCRVSHLLPCVPESR